jgi:RimJ/RimL family protein N-acetyltransferase
METGFSPPESTGAAPHASPAATSVATVSGDWRQSVPVLTSRGLSLREVTQQDASSLLAMLGTDDVARFISPLPPTADAFVRFVTWAHQQRTAGQYICFSVLPQGMSTAIGVFQVRSLEPGFATAEWGFALGSPFWGTGLFVEAARLVLDFAFHTIGVHRLEARASVDNGRGNGALMKLRATQEGVLRRSFLWHGEYHDQVLWSILDSDWRDAAAASGPGGVVAGAVRSD